MQTANPLTAGGMQNVPPGGAVTVIRLSPVENPHATHDHSLAYAVGKAEGSASLDQVVELRQGYQDEQDLGLLIASWRHPDVGQEPVNETQLLTDKQAGRITNYGALSVRIVHSPHG